MRFLDVAPGDPVPSLSYEFTPGEIIFLTSVLRDWTNSDNQEPMKTILGEFVRCFDFGMDARHEMEARLRKENMR